MINNSDIGVYIHVPFCVAKCHYCAFYSINTEQDLIEKYVERICRDIKFELQPHAEKIKTIFIGGGNPTAIGNNNLAKIVEAILSVVNCDNISEFTIESNPETINNDLISFFQQIPKIRLSIGIQRLDNGELGILGRLGNMSHIDKVLDMVLPEIKNVSADIIIGVPNCLDLSEKLDTFLSTYKLQHLSAYFLTVEDGTVLQSRIENGSFPSPDDIGPEEMFNIRDVLTGHDFEHYEISNYAKETFRCKHNMHYWKQGDYIGLGPSAVGTVMGGKRLAQQSDLRSWLSVDNASIENLTATDLRNEFVMLGLRLVEDGLNIEILESKFGKQSDKFYISLKESVNNGFLQWNNSIVKLTDNGMSFSNSVMGQLFEE